MTWDEFVAAGRTRRRVVMSVGPPEAPRYVLEGVPCWEGETTPGDPWWFGVSPYLRLDTGELTTADPQDCRPKEDR